MPGLLDSSVSEASDTLRRLASRPAKRDPCGSTPEQRDASPGRLAWPRRPLDGPLRPPWPPLATPRSGGRRGLASRALRARAFLGFGGRLSREDELAQPANPVKREGAHPVESGWCRRPVPVLAAHERRITARGYGPSSAMSALDGLGNARATGYRGPKTQKPGPPVVSSHRVESGIGLAVIH